ncbi:hypothetical protein KC19_2G271700 [Ceratodon purpureus]|uniref:Uncharacterized protein n=1 Tax=Ceratodon purpureus TaxID=3225 RepID=A0A8T0IYL3_CERPU|nr:hypothetical protein KC19_2G271700 [Ceratodon purpureus]
MSSPDDDDDGGGPLCRTNKGSQVHNFITSPALSSPGIPDDAVLNHSLREHQQQFELTRWYPTYLNTSCLAFKNIIPVAPIYSPASVADLDLEQLRHIVS